MAQIYIVEDDDNIRELVEYALTAAGHTCEGFIDAPPFYEALHIRLPDLILLDIMLPGEDGVSILTHLRRDPLTRTLPIILLTARTSELDKVRGLDSGADDYITKPFSVLELTSRVRALLRRAQSSAPPEALVVDPVTLDPARRTVHVGTRPVTLTYKEFELLHYLMLNRGIVLTRTQIMEAVWGAEFEGESRTIDMHVLSLRQKLAEASGVIRTVRNVGYKMGE